MATIAVVGATGYAGSNIVEAAAARGHAVTGYSRTAPERPVAGVTYVQGDITDPALQDAVVKGADVVISALSPRGALENGLPEVLTRLAGRVREAGARFGVVGGAGSLLVSEAGPKVADTDGFPEEFKAEARTMDTALEDLRAADPALDWFFVSPAGGFGAWAPGEATGVFRTGGDLLLVDAEGNSAISGADFAAAVVNEVERPEHSRRRFTVAY